MESGKSNESKKVKSDLFYFACGFGGGFDQGIGRDGGAHGLLHPDVRGKAAQAAHALHLGGHGLALDELLHLEVMRKPRG